MEKKITVLGDIMCEPLLLKAAKKGGGYDFSPVFEPVQELLSEADFVIGNLEAPLAGEVAGYSRSLFSFNAPDSFAEAAHKAGINLFLTANNHCLDRGVEGLIRTATVLKDKGIPFTGTAATPQERQEAEYFTLEDSRVAIISYTYGTNYAANHAVLNKEQKTLVNLLRPQEELFYIPSKGGKVSLPKKAFNKALRMFSKETQYSIKKALGMTYNVPRMDDSLNKDTVRPYIARMEQDIATARENADIVIFCPHMGGQFNIKPGVFSEYICDAAMNAGCHAIIASHPHIVQKAEIQKNRVPVFFSLGNFSMSPNSAYLLHEHLPEYGLAAHLYIDNKAITSAAFSVLKIVEERHAIMKVYPADVYDAQLQSDWEKQKFHDEVKQIYETVTGRKDPKWEIRREYQLP